MGILYGYIIIYPISHITSVVLTARKLGAEVVAHLNECRISGINFKHFTVK